MSADTIDFPVAEGPVVLGTVVAEEHNHSCGSACFNADA